jgi:ribose transport system ATP-binding protein
VTADTAMTAAPLVRMAGIRKSFGAVHALRGVDFSVDAGEVVGLIGANGAGKSTLVKVLAGASTPDDGAFEFDGAQRQFGHPGAAARAGIAFVPQELELIPDQTVADNIYLGRLPSRLGWIRQSSLDRGARELLDRVGLGAIDPGRLAGSLTAVEQRFLSIAQALSKRPRVLILDEPTAAMAGDTAVKLGELIGEVAAAGTAIVYISHRLEEVERFTTRVVAMRDGRVAGELVGSRLSAAAMVELVAGGEAMSAQAAAPAPAPAGAPVLRVSGLYGNKVADVDLEVQAGEIVGVGGLQGSGRSELLRLIAGHQRPVQGTVEYLGRPGPRSPREAAQGGIGYLVEERRRMLFRSMDTVSNATIAHLPSMSAGRFWLQPGRELAAYREIAERTRVAGVADAQVWKLSGGNQQKICLSRWLLGEHQLLVLDEPTVGIDVHARWEIHNLLRELAAEGTAILVACAEPEELVLLCQRVVILREGEIAARMAAPLDSSAVVAASYRAAARS